MPEATMTAVYLDEPEVTSIREIPVPEPAPGEVLVKIRSVGICGSDVHYFEHGRIGDFVVEEPLILGHECAGTVVKLGEGVESLSEGQPVALEPGIPCRHCDHCLSGNYNLCPDVQFMATPPVDGSFCEYVTSPEDFAFPLPEGMSYEAGSTAEPMAVACHSARKAGLEPGQTVVVLGAGPVGLFHVGVADSMGADRIVAVDLIDARLELARSMGATCTLNAGSDDVSKLNGCADAVFECSGALPAIQQSLEVAASGGAVIWIGMGPDEIRIPFAQIQPKELQIHGVFRYANCYPMAISLMGRGRVDPEPMITHRFEFPEVHEALDFARSHPEETVKVMVNFPE